MLWNVLEHLEGVAVVAIEPMLSAEPHESAIILQSLQHARLREPIARREARKPDVETIGDAEPE